MPRRKVILRLTPDLVDETTNQQTNQLAELLAWQYMQNGASYD